MLPVDVPRDAVIVTRNLQREYDMGGEMVRALAGRGRDHPAATSSWPSWGRRARASPP